MTKFPSSTPLSLFFAAMLATPSTALAEEQAAGAPAAPALAPPAAHDNTAIRKNVRTAATSQGLFLEFKLGSSIGYSANVFIIGVSPAFIIGYKLGRLVLGAELGAGMSESKQEYPDSTYKNRSFGFSVVPLLQYSIVQNGPFALYLAGGAGLVMGFSKYPDFDNYKSRSTGLLIHLGFGVRYFLHPRFAVGLEMSADANYFRAKGESDTESDKFKHWSVGLRGALTVAVVF